MKILAFCDLHEDYGYAETLERKAKDVDIIVCVGDITVFGDNLEQAVKFLDSFGKKVFCVHGNHESEVKMKKLCDQTKNVIFIHKKVYVWEGVAFMGYGGGGFSSEEEGLIEVEEQFSEACSTYKKTVLITHAPPYETKIDMIHKDCHVGNRTLRRFIDKNQPLVVVSGHIHEAFRKTDKIKNSVLVNPGPDGAIIHI